jgi:hypothetical protein
MFQGGGQMIPDGGYESTTTVQAPQSGTVTFVQYNNRFALTGLGRMYDKHAKQGEVLSLNYYAAKKVLEAMGRKMGYQTYGYSTGTSPWWTRPPPSRRTPTSCSSRRSGPR